MVSKLVLYLLYYSTIILPKNVVTSSEDLLIFDDIMDEIINDCYAGDFKTIAIFEHFHRRVDPPPTFPVVKTEYAKYILNIYSVLPPRDSLSTADASFILTNTSQVLNETLMVLATLDVFTYKAPVFIFAGKHDFSIPDLFSYILWEKWSILTAYFIFEESPNSIFVITSNPYGPYAPKQWKYFGTRINLFGRYYNKGQLCRGFRYDRTKRLKKRHLRFLSSTEYTEGLYEGEDQRFCNGHWDPMIPIFETALNTKSLLLCANRSQPNADFRIFQTFKPDLTFFSLAHPRSTLSYPPHYITITMLSHNQGYQTLFEQMISLFGKWIVLFTCGLLTITFFVCFHLAKSDKISFGLFEIIRLLTNASIKTNINGLVLKIFFLTIFLYFLIMQSLFQGKLAGFLTNPSPRKNAECLEDLESPAYKGVWSNTVSIGPYYSFYQKIMQNVDYDNVVQLFKNNKSIAIIDHFGTIGRVLTEYSNEVYIAKEPILTQPYFYTLRRANPLNKRINYILLVNYELGFSELLKLQLHATYWNHLKRLKYLSLTKGINKPIDLESLTSLLIMLGIGYVAATICFIGEIVVYRLRRSRSVLIQTAPKLSPKSKSQSSKGNDRRDNEEGEESFQ